MECSSYDLGLDKVKVLRGSELGMAAGPGTEGLHLDLGGGCSESSSETPSERGLGGGCWSPVLHQEQPKGCRCLRGSCCTGACGAGASVSLAALLLYQCPLC